MPPIVYFKFVQGKINLNTLCILGRTVKKKAKDYMAIVCRNELSWYIKATFVFNQIHVYIISCDKV